MDRLLATEVDDVATRLEYTDAVDLRRAVSMAARRIGHAVDLTSRAARQVLPVRRKLSFVRRERRPQYTQAPHGLIVHQGEVGLDRLTSPSTPLLDLRAGALAAQRGLVLSPITADNLREHAPPIPTPWPDEARVPLFELLSGGPGLLPVWESLDLAGCIVRWFPAWQGISAQPQHNPVHRHTVDRHSVQCVAEVQRHLTQVDRPDLLLVAVGRGPVTDGLGSPACCTTSASYPARAPHTRRSVRRSLGKSRSRSVYRGPTSSWSSDWSAST